MAFEGGVLDAETRRACGVLPSRLPGTCARTPDVTARLEAAAVRILPRAHLACVGVPYCASVMIGLFLNPLYLVKIVCYQQSAVGKIVCYTICALGYTILQHKRCAEGSNLTQPCLARDMP